MSYRMKMSLYEMWNKKILIAKILYEFFFRRGSINQRQCSHRLIHTLFMVNFALCDIMTNRLQTVCIYWALLTMRCMKYERWRKNLFLKILWVILGVKERVKEDGEILFLSFLHFTIFQGVITLKIRKVSKVSVF